METLQLIIECTMDEEREKLIESLAVVKYRLPMIDSYVIELPAASLPLLHGIHGVRAVHRNASITAQMNVARKTIKADAAIQSGLTGRGVCIAILDTGVAPVDDLTMPRDRIVVFKDMVNGKKEAYDDNGHGTHVAGIAAGNGYCSNGKYMGIAPESNIAAIKILDVSGRGSSAEVLAGIQWMMDNRERYNIRVANLSIGTPDTGDRDPLVRAVEAAWDSGIVITIAAGNNGPLPGSITSPGISRKVVTIGASDDTNAVQIWGDTLENFSGRGPTSECVIKPDIVAPGADIISCLSPSITCLDNRDKKIIYQNYLQLSGTSMSTPMVSGAVALLLEKHPHLTPNDVKLRIKKSALSLNCLQNQQGWGVLDIQKMLSE